MAQFMNIYYTMLQIGLIILKNTLTLTLLIIAKFTDEQYTTINQSTVGRFDPRVLVNCLQAFTPITCKLLTKTLRSKSPAVDWLIVLYYSSVNCTTINATMSLYSTYWSCWRIYTHYLTMRWHVLYNYILSTELNVWQNWSYRRYKAAYFPSVVWFYTNSLTIKL